MTIDASFEQEVARHIAPSRLQALLELPPDFIDLLPVAAYACDASGRILWFNKRAADLWGRAPLVGDDDSELFCGSYRLYFGGRHIDRTETPMALALRSGESIHGVEGIVERPDGSRIWTTVHIDPVKDASGNVLGAINCFYDTTALHEGEARLSIELDATRQLQEISAELIHEHGVEGLYEKIIGAAVSIMRSDFGSMQMLHPERGKGGELHLLAFRGFNPQAAKFWEWVRADSESTCGAALRSGKRVIAADVNQCDFMAGTQDLETYLQTGIHAVQTTPLISRSGRLLGMISTHWRNPHNPTESDLRRLDVLARQAADLIEHAQGEERLRDSEERLRLATEAADVGLWDVDTINDTLFWPPRVKEMFGISADVPVSMADFYAGLHPEDRERTSLAFADALDADKRALYDVEYRTVGKEDGVVRWVAAKGRGMFDASGKCVRVIGTAIDITARKHDEEHRKLLLHELDHRVKNTLATVQSLAAQTLRNASGLGEAREAFEARLLALSKAHDVLTREHWEGADLNEIVDKTLAAYSDGDHVSRLRCAGPEIRLQPKAALALSMALHELATNAVKYGALSNGTGRVDISWRMADGNFQLRWAEGDGPPVDAPRRRGFGSRLIEQGLAHDLAGKVGLDFRKEGIVCTIEAPLAEVRGEL